VVVRLQASDPTAEWCPVVGSLTVVLSRSSYAEPLYDRLAQVVEVTGWSSGDVPAQPSPDARVT
jgi:hypothetical protein